MSAGVFELLLQSPPLLRERLAPQPLGLGVQALPGGDEGRVEAIPDVVGRQSAQLRLSVELLHPVQDEVPAAAFGTVVAEGVELVAELALGDLVHQLGRQQHLGDAVIGRRDLEVQLGREVVVVLVPLEHTSQATDTVGLKVGERSGHDGRGNGNDSTGHMSTPIKVRAPKRHLLGYLL